MGVLITLLTLSYDLYHCLKLLFKDVHTYSYGLQEVLAAAVHFDLHFIIRRIYLSQNFSPIFSNLRQPFYPNHNLMWFAILLAVSPILSASFNHYR
jgi:hypothetical protein